LERVLVVVGHDAGLVATVVGRLGRGRVEVVYAERWADGNGASLAGVQREVQGQALFLLVTADHIFAEGALAWLLAVGAPAVLIDPAPTGRPGGRALGSGWWTGPWSPSASIWRSRGSTVAGAVTRLAQTQPLRAVALPAGCWWQDVDTPRTCGRRSGRCAAR
jgi:CTP:molybdopterin cytidylyltransferase MocA